MPPLEEEEVRKMLRKIARNPGDKAKIARSFFNMPDNIFRSQVGGFEPLGDKILGKLGLDRVQDQKNRTLYLEVKKE